jgi:predicted dehydrogenase
MAYKVAIIGAGNIGAFRDNPQSSNILTHAHGFSDNECFELVGFVDSDLKKAQIASDCWGGRSFESIEKLFSKHEVDVVSICVPDEFHFDALLSLSKTPVKLIFLEKPAVKTVDEANVVMEIYSGQPKRILVNYTRRFVPEIRNIRDNIKKGEYGAFITGTGYYGKGILHNGSHMMDLLKFLVGDVGDIKKISETVDYYTDDPSVSALLNMKHSGIFFLKHIDCRKFDIFEMDLTFEKKRIRIFELGTKIEEYAVGDNKLFEGYRTLNKEREYPTKHQNAMYYAVNNIRNNLEMDEPLVCALDEAVETLKTCTKILQG